MDPSELQSASRPRPSSRREFLTGAAAAALSFVPPTGAARAAGDPQSMPATWSRPKATVVEVRSPRVVRGPVVHPGELRTMLTQGLTELTGAATEVDAWKGLLSPEDVIGLKFNQSGATGLGTTPALAGALVASLVASGWPVSRIVAIEIPNAQQDMLGTVRPRTDWLVDEIAIGDARDRLSGVLEQVTAIINVPFLKTHNLAGMTCCLKNLTHALVKHPAQFHGRGCAQIADIMALPQINAKIRLHLVNALRVVIDGGPEVRPEFVVDRGSLAFSTNGVATDAVSLEILNQMRTAAAMRPLGEFEPSLGYLLAAEDKGLGPSDLHEIEWRKRPI